MKELYIISIDMSEESVYFTQMNSAQASKMRQLLGRTGYNFSVQPVKHSPGYNNYKSLMADLEDLTNRRG